ncbi:hypothetical protein QMK17_24770 [Rhodococcus sp. G-MC3]|uniref:hypothetical protein n=1 Tax=Rhodococcus sp. G-MC3 TaxID=3046209 RepID=UPI0024BBC8DE|nr:hypothetical protein [Rhodococcus sp. G-MC3]MDJ0396519.1 hypothetical protein [Rhodococcus sp. G-MC3]
MRDRQLKAEITHVHGENYSVYGARKVWLQSRGILREVTGNYSASFATGVGVLIVSVVLTLLIQEQKVEAAPASDPTELRRTLASG